jgi:hypothetical protein
MSKYRAINIFITLFFLLAIFVFFAQGWPSVIQAIAAHNEPDNLSFNFSRCDSNAQIGTDSIQKTQWTENGEFVVHATVVPNCGTTWILGNYSVSGKDLTLTYQPIVSTYLACVCYQNLEFEISGLPKKKYNLQLKADAEIDAQAKWFWTLYSKL